MAGCWEVPETVLVGILHTEVTTLAWSFGLRNLIVPGEIMPVAGMPYDHARNVVCMRALEMGVDACFRNGTIVDTSEGGKRIENVRVGDMVRTHKNRFRRVSEVFHTPYRQRSPVLWVKTENSLTKCTPNHPFYISRGGRSGSFVRASELIAGDVLLHPDKDDLDYLDWDVKYNTVVETNGKKGSIKDGSYLGNLPVTEDIAYFLGLYLAEGCSCSSGVRFTFGNHESHLVDFVNRMASLLFDRRVTVCRRWSTNVTINVRNLGKRFHQWFGRGAKHKRIPDFVFNWSLRNRLRFLKGYLDGDGCYQKGTFVKNGKEYKRCPVWGYVTAGRLLSEDIVRLSNACGLHVKTTKVKSGVSVMSNGQQIKSSGAWVGWFALKSCQKVTDLLSATYSDGYFRIPVTEVLLKKMDHRHETVYNMEVEEDHSYIADVGAVHNCFFLDSDVIPPRDAILRLLAHKKPFISGVYHRRSPPVGVPVMIKNGGWVTQYPANTVMEVDLVGAGCLLMRRELLEQMPPIRPDAGKHWFSWQVDLPQTPANQGWNLSEDFSMNRWIREKMGIPILVDTGLQCKHVGFSEVTYAKMDALHCNVHT